MENYTLSKTDHDYKALDVLHKIWGFIMSNILSLILEGILKAFGVT